MQLFEESLTTSIRVTGGKWLEFDENATNYTSYLVFYNQRRHGIESFMHLWERIPELEHRHPVCLCEVAHNTSWFRENLSNETCRGWCGEFFVKHQSSTWCNWEACSDWIKSREHIGTHLARKQSQLWCIWFPYVFIFRILAANQILFWLYVLECSCSV